MTNEAQKIVDEMAEYLRHQENKLRTLHSERWHERILAAATKPKHPTPYQFPLVHDYSIVDVQYATNGRQVPHVVVLRQLDAANHAIAHLRSIVLDGRSEAAGFLFALDNGYDFPEMPK